MKRILFVFIIFILNVGYSFSQQFHGGIMAGLAGTQVAGDSYSGFKKAGIFAGGFVSLDVGGESSMRMEITYFQKGSRENPTEKNGNSRTCCVGRQTKNIYRTLYVVYSFGHRATHQHLIQAIIVRCNSEYCVLHQ